MSGQMSAKAAPPLKEGASLDINLLSKYEDGRDVPGLSEALSEFTSEEALANGWRPFRDPYFIPDETKHALYTGLNFADHPTKQMDGITYLRIFHREFTGERGEEHSECAFVLSVGEGCAGHPGVLHGGVTAMFFDEVTGCLSIQSLRKPTFTVYLNTVFKRPAPTKSVLVYRARRIEPYGHPSKCYMKAEGVTKAPVPGPPGMASSDGGGEEVVFATCECLYIVPQSQL
eukprot:Clim_evm3s171 gene=Clim_evmTU3s171